MPLAQVKIGDVTIYWTDSAGMVCYPKIFIYKLGYLVMVGGSYIVCDRTGSIMVLDHKSSNYLVYNLIDIFNKVSNGIRYELRNQSITKTYYLIISDHVAELVKLYFSLENFAGLELHEFLRKII